MTANTQFKTLVREWLKAKKPMVAPSTHAAFTLIAENQVDAFVETLGKAYEERFGLRADFYVAEIGDGAGELVVSS